MTATFSTSGLGFGALTGWAIQSSNSTDENKRATAPNNIGNVTQSELYDDTTNVTTTYKAAVKTAPAIPSSIGAVVNGILLTGIQISTDSEDFATMTLTGHVHVDGGHGTCKSIAHGITLARGFGSSPFGVTGGETVRSSEVSISCEHLDVPGENGHTVQGENYNPRIEITARVLGSGATLPSGYERLEVTEEGEATDFQYETIRGIKDLAFTA